MQVFPTDDKAKDLHDLDLRCSYLPAYYWDLEKDSFTFRVPLPENKPFTRRRAPSVINSTKEPPRISSCNNTLKLRRETTTTTSCHGETSERQHTPNAYIACYLAWEYVGPFASYCTPFVNALYNCNTAWRLVWYCEKIKQLGEAKKWSRHDERATCNIKIEQNIIVDLDNSSLNV